MYTFEEIIGHSHIIQSLQNGIRYQKVSHAYILDGAPGMGKKLIANTFAKTLQCLVGGITPCNQCISCQAFDSANHPDIFYVKSTRTKSIGVDDIREQIGQDIEIKPYRYKYKVYIIEDADTMTVQAQNAILKTIEEPPEYGIFLLLSQNFNRFLPTILSRCALLKLKPLSLTEIKQYLHMHLQVSRDKIEIYSTFAQGSIGKAKEIMETDTFMDMREKVLEWMRELYRKDLYGVLETQKNFEVYKERIQEVLDILYIWYRDVLVVKQLGMNGYILQKDQEMNLYKAAEQLSYRRIYESLDCIQMAKEQIRQNANFQLTLEVMLLNLKES